MSEPGYLDRLAAYLHGVSLRVRVAAAFLAVACVLALGVGMLAYQTAAQLIETDAEQRFDDAVEQAVGDLDSSGGILLRFEQNPDDQSAGFDLLSQDELSIQALTPDGTILAQRGLTRQVIPAEEADIAAARAAEPGEVERRESDIDGERYRIATISLGGGSGALQLAQRLAPTEQLLDSLRDRMLAVGAVAVLVAGAVGWLVGWRVTRRLGRLTATAERVSATGRLEDAVPDDPRSGSGDEVGRLASAFNAMLARLAGAREDQRRLVEDAAHELRTPLTSLRTNVAMLPRLEALPMQERQRLLEDLRGETRELSDLVSELVQLATDRHSEEDPRPLRLADLAHQVAARIHRRTGRTVDVQADEGPDAPSVMARPHALERALSNVVENAAKFTPADSGPIEVAVSGGRVEVRDRGPGIGAADAEHIFDRFYRATASRALPGSGLGLAIVREIVVQHGGEVFACDREGGGAAIGFTLPTQLPDRARP